MRYLDFTTLESKDGCETPGGGAAYLMGGVRASFEDSSFRHTSVANGNGGAVVISSDFSKMNATERSAADFTRCTFDEYSADFYGQAAFSSVSQLRLFDTNIAPADGASSLEAGTVFDFGVASDCSVGLRCWQYGVCEAVDRVFSCNIGTCLPCPIGTYRAEPGAVSLEQCLPCPVGTFSGVEGAAGCDECDIGSYVTLLTRNADGLGTSLGGEACVQCPAGRESNTTGSVLCDACSAGESSEVGKPCISW